MSPASTTEIIIAKIAPLFVLLFLMVLFAIVVMQVVFDVPFHGRLLLVLGGAALCILCGISIGTVIATFSKSARAGAADELLRQSSAFHLSGAFYPVEAMPHIVAAPHDIQPDLSLRGDRARGVAQRQRDSALWPNFLALTAFTLVLVVLSVWRFRKQLS